MLDLIGAGLLSGILLIGLNRQIRRWRRRRLKSLELIPNCLLTRYPIVFISGRRSVLYCLEYWNEVPSFLREHGYDVLVFDPPWRNPVRRRESIDAFLRALETPVHLIGDSSVEDELKYLRERAGQLVISISMIQADSRTADTGHATLRPEDLAPRQDGIQTVDLSSPDKQSLRAHVLVQLQAALLFLHNLLLFPNRRIHPVEIGVTVTHEPWLVERKFLELAVSLAERDLREAR